MIASAVSSQWVMIASTTATVISMWLRLAWRMLERRVSAAESGNSSPALGGGDASPTSAE